jgi:hypothetical protein
MKAINAESGILLKEGTPERSTAKTKKVSLGKVFFKTPAIIAGFLISAFPLSLPVFYLIALLFME